MRQQALQQLIFSKKSLAARGADRLGMQVTDAEHAERVRQLLPTAFQWRYLLSAWTLTQLKYRRDFKWLCRSSSRR